MRTRQMQALKAGLNLAGKFRLKEPLVRGSFKEVWLAKKGPDTIVVTLFKVEKGFNRSEWKHIRDASAVQRKLEHPHLLKPLAIGITKGMPYLALPYMQAGTVRDRREDWDELGLTTLLYQAAIALEELHSQTPPVIHGSIRPENFLIGYQGNFLLSDYCISGYLKDQLSPGHPALSARQPYQAPECFNPEASIGPEADIFSLGVCIYELASGTLPFGETGSKPLVTGEIDPEPLEGFSVRFNQVVQICMAKGPDRRPDAKTLARLARRFLDRGEWQSVSGFSFAVPEQVRNTNTFPKVSVPKLGLNGTEDIKEKLQQKFTIKILLIIGTLIAVIVGFWIIGTGEDGYSLSDDSEPVELQANYASADSLKTFFELSESLKSHMNYIESSDSTLTEIDMAYMEQIRKYLVDLDSKFSETLNLSKNDSSSIISWKNGAEDPDWLKSELEDVRKYKRHILLIRERIEPD